MPDLRDLIAGYNALNAWELEERRRRLPQLTVEESIRQYLEMCDLVRHVSPEAEAIFLPRRIAHYEALHKKLERAAKVMGRVV
jgi:hypothetical protein